MVVLRSGILLLASAHLPGRVDGWSLATSSDALFHIARSVGLVELALAAMVALVCGAMLVIAGVITTTDLSGISRRLLPLHAVCKSDSNDISLAALSRWFR